MTERRSVKKTFLVHGFKLRASLYMRDDGSWKIVSIGAVDYPTALLPVEVSSIAMDLVRRDAFPNKLAAYYALESSGY